MNENISVIISEQIKLDWIKERTIRGEKIAFKAQRAKLRGLLLRYCMTCLLKIEREGALWIEGGRLFQSSLPENDRLVFTISSLGFGRTSTLSLEVAYLVFSFLGIISFM